MIGAIIGDIVGSRWEFNSTNDYDFKWLSSDNDFTDDTICTIAVADALLHDSKDFGKYIHEWCRKYPSPTGGYGGRFAQWVHSDNPQPYGSFGNGAAMRVSPVAHWFDDDAQVLEAAKATALPTHNHPEGIKGAQTVALAIFKALCYNRASYQDAPMHIDEILQACVEFSGYDINMPKASVLNKFDETCQGTVPVALKIISMAANFEDAIRMAVSLGADADTLGAIVGSIAEAIWGIPLEMRMDFKYLLPVDMHRVIIDFRKKRPSSFKPLIDTCYAHNDFCNVCWDVYYDIDEDAYDEEIKKVLDRYEQRRMIMKERAKARENW